MGEGAPGGGGGSVSKGGGPHFFFGAELPTKIFSVHPKNGLELFPLHDVRPEHNFFMSVVMFV